MDVKKQRMYSAPFALFEKKPQEKGFLLEEKEFDKNGNMLRSTRYFEDGSTDEIAEFKYDDKGRMVEEKIFYTLSDSTDVRRFYYDDEKMTEEEVYYYGDEEGEKTLTRKNDQGEPEEIRRLDESGQIVKKEVVEYYKKGMPSLEAEYTGEGVLLKEVRSEYDAEDRLVKQQITSADEMEIDQTLEISYEENREIAKAYDDQGELIYTRTRHFNKAGHLEKFIHADAGTGQQTIQRITYDDNNNPTLVEWRSGNDDLMRKQETDYNEEGHMISEFIFDLHPVTGQQSHMVTNYEYEYFEG